jgi:hypothetical protein
MSATYPTRREVESRNFSPRASSSRTTLSSLRKSYHILGRYMGIARYYFYLRHHPLHHLVLSLLQAPPTTRLWASPRMSSTCLESGGGGSLARPSSSARSMADRETGGHIQRALRVDGGGKERDRHHRGVDGDGGDSDHIYRIHPISSIPALSPWRRRRSPRTFCRGLRERCLCYTRP